MTHITSARIRKIESLCRRQASILRREHGEMARAQVKKLSQQETGMALKEKLTKELIKDLTESYPKDGFSHEGDVLKAPQDDAFTWHINALGGFENFLRGKEDFYQIFVLTKAGQPVEAFGYTPLYDQTSLAVHNNGATGYETRLRVSGRKTLEESCVHLDTLNADVANKLTQAGVHLRATGSAYQDILDVCAGRADCFYAQSLPQTEAFFADLMVRESGGKVSSWDGKKPFIAANIDAFYYINKLMS